MKQETDNGHLTRRKVLRAGGIAGGLAAGAPLLVGATAGTSRAATRTARETWAPAGTLPTAEIEKIMRAQGTVSNGVLNIEIDRDDIANVTKDGVPVKPGFEINGNFCFQAAPGGVIMNGDLAFKPGELDPAIDAMIAHGLTWQAEHQHLFGLTPMVWFMHMRGHGTARQVAEGCAAVLAATSVPLPQAPPKHPTTPLDVKRLERIIGSSATVGSDGVVSFQIPRRERITLGGVRISPYLNVYTPVDFEPLGGDRAAVVPDFGLTAGEVNRVARMMRGQGWELDCLYNQETDECPQLYFSHQWKVGNAYTLAAEVRRGLEQTNVVLG
jgi:hypothetical protein